MKCRSALGLVLAIGTATSFIPRASAEPVLTPGPKAGAATAWTVEAAKVTLTIGDRYDPVEVASAIEAGVPGAKAAAADRQIEVTGVEPEKLLAALVKIEAAPALDDVDAMLQALQSGGDQEEGTGSSIRATRAMAADQLLGPKEERLQATVLAVQRGKFPLVVISIRIDKAPPGAQVSTGDKTTIVPRIRNRTGKIAPDDDQSLLNAGAWYAQPGDKIEIRLDRRGRKVWWVRAYRRKT